MSANEFVFDECRGDGPAAHDDCPAVLWRDHPYLPTMFCTCKVCACDVNLVVVS